ncbi:hypothetical protein HPB52_012746 [Rhipicephalus sanguineus]|uniref:Uncharacterized protein n=1 Tax=Rhipicephalus sanguineus TaxID=34632 RepID=A0A9D4PIP5_RHISA|nr:hypothetical protein HPB52_012746 [Rhipicephalus sanguineus]
MDGLKDDLVSAMKEALEELDRRQLRRFEEFLRCVLGKGAQCSAENIGETSKVQERASVEEQRIVDGSTVANEASTPMSEPADGSLSEVMTEHQQDACGSGEPVKEQLLSQPAPLSYEPFVQKLLPYTRCNDFLLDPRGECLYVRSPGEEHAEATQLNKLYVDDCSKLRNFLARRTVHFSSSVNSALMHDSDNHLTEDTVALGADGSRMYDWQDHANGLKNVRRAQKRELQAADIGTNVPTVDSTSSVAYGKVARHRKERPLRVTEQGFCGDSNSRWFSDEPYGGRYVVACFPTTEGRLAEAAGAPVSSNIPPPAPRQPLPSGLMSRAHQLTLHSQAPGPVYLWQIAYNPGFTRSIDPISSWLTELLYLA